MIPPGREEERRPGRMAPPGRAIAATGSSVGASSGPGAGALAPHGPRHSRRPTTRRPHPSWEQPAEPSEFSESSDQTAVTDGYVRPESWSRARSAGLPPDADPDPDADPGPDADALTDLLPAFDDPTEDDGGDDADAEPSLFDDFARPDDPEDPDGPDDRPGEDGFGVGRGRGRRRRGRRRGWVLPAVVVILVVALGGGAWFARDLVGLVVPADFDGPGTGSVVVQVGEGDSVRAVGAELADEGVVASARAFDNAAEDDARGRDVSPGFYALRREMSAQQALDALLEPGSRLGRLEVRGGTQLDDTVGVGDATVPGMYSLVARATCAPDPAGAPVCRTPAEIAQVAATADPAALGVPDWALAEVRQVDPRRRLEGLVVPGVYDVRPGADAAEALTQVLGASVSRIENTGLVSGARTLGITPYQALVVASIAEKEGVEQDFGKITRVIENRLPIPMRLQMDSTINYPLDRQTLLTTPFDRAAPGPYNTYLNLGLPPTPIAAASPAAIRAAVDPDPGQWIYFVKCETSGASCFAVTPEEHDVNRRLAQERGVY